MRDLMLASLLCWLALVACARPITSAEINGAQCTPASAPSRLRPQQVAEHVQALVEANCIEHAQVWYFRGLVRAGVESALVPQESAFEAYSILARSAAARSFPDSDPLAIAELLEDAIRWEAATPLEYPAAPSPAALAEARNNVAAFLREGVIHEQERRAAVSAVQEQISGGVTDEARSIVGGAAASVLTPLGSVHVDCDDTIYFVGRYTHAPAASADGRIAAIETCDDYRIIDTQLGATLRSVTRTDYNAIIARADESAVQVVLAQTQENASSSGALLFVMSPTHSIRPLTLPLPRDVRPHSRLEILRTAGSADGNIVVLEFSTGRGVSSRYVAYDLRNLTMLWEGREVGNGRTRLMWRVEHHEGDYVLISELRRNRFDLAGGERLNLRTGRQEFVDYASLPVDYVDDDVPTCDLVETNTSAESREFGYFLNLPAGRARFALQEPPRSSISDCTVTSNGTQLLVAVPPFIHRFSIGPR